jgi:4'-phosphopantetheinyl transferase
LHGIDAVRREAFARGQIMENGVSVDDFPPPGKLDRPPAAGNAISLPRVSAPVDLWWFALDRDEDEAAALAGTLSAEEVARAERFGTAPLRRRWIVGRATLRALLGRALDIAPTAVTLVRGRRGRPQLAVPTLDFNVSHTCGMALVAIAATPHDRMRVGVDVEHGDRRVNADGLSRKFLSAREQSALAPLAPDERRRGFLRLWTCKEAMSKATGDALAAPFRHLDVSRSGGLALAAGPAPYLPAHWALHAVDMPGGFLATVAVWDPNPPIAATKP